MSDTPWVPPSQPVPPSMSQPMHGQPAMSEAVKLTTTGDPAGPPAIRMQGIETVDDIEGFIRIDSRWRETGDGFGGNTGPLLVRIDHIEAFNVNGSGNVILFLASGRSYTIDGDAATQVLAQIAR